MRICVVVSLLFLLLSGSVFGQEAVYLANGNRAAGRLTGLSDEKIRISVLRNGQPKEYLMRRENVLMAVSGAGRYLLISDLSPDPLVARQQIADFQKGTAKKPGYDVILKINPAKALPGLIGYESDEIINFKQPNGTAATINRNEVAAVFYRDGRHALLIPVVQVTAALNSARADMKRWQGASAKIPPPKKTGPPTKKPADSAVATTNPTTAKPAPAKPVLTDEQYKQYRNSALQKVDRFVAFLNVLSNKEANAEEKDKAIDQAAELFLPEATIEVTSANKPGVRKYKVKDYLMRLKMVPYQSSTIEWSEIQYIKELTKAADGAYYGIISGQQTFNGYGGKDGDDILYSDVTQKNVQVKLDTYEKSKNGKQVLNWEVLLGNIGLVVK
jgi:hypothetical protein